MTPAEFRHTIKSLGLSQVGAASFLGVNDRTVRRWILGEVEIPEPVSRFLLFLVAADIKPNFVVEKLGLGSTEPENPKR